jgi:AraC-like DNA-binding protein
VKGADNDTSRVSADQSAAPREQLDGPLGLNEFRAQLRANFPPLEIATPDHETFRGEITPYALDEIHLIRIRATRHVMTRSEAQARQPATGFYKVMLQRRGTSLLSQRGRSTALSAGDLVAYDTAEPYTLALDDDTDLVLYVIPHGILHVPRYMVDDYVVGRVLNTDLASQPINEFLIGLADRIHLLRPELRSRFAPVIAELSETLFRLHIDEEHALRTSKIVKFEQIVDYVEAHLLDPGLSPRAIADAHFISARYLQEIFQMHGMTATAWIRHRRLEHCRHALRAPRNTGKSVAAIAAEWGFTDAAHFSRAFRREFGVSPSSIRS